MIHSIKSYTEEPRLKIKFALYVNIMYENTPPFQILGTTGLTDES